MSFNGSGTFLINTAGQPVVSGTVISSTAFNALTADLATGLSTAITKDGQTTVTANIPMSTYKFTGLGVGSAATDSANLSQVQSTVTKLLTSVSGADTITAVGAPVVAAYAAGQMFYFVATGDNTGAVTLNIDALGAKAVTRDGSVALAAGDIKSGEVVVVVYDGTRFQVVSQLNSAGNATFANVSITSALNVGGVVTLSGGTANGVLYLNGSKVATSGTALVFDGTNLSGTGSIGTTIAGKTAQFDAAGGSIYASFADGTKTWRFGAGIQSAGTVSLYNATDAVTAFTVDATGNLGIGTSSPASALYVKRTSGNAGIYADYNGTNVGRLEAASNGNLYLGTTTGTGSVLVGTTANAAALELNNNGNLGLGVTPSAWGSGQKALQTPAGAIWNFNNANMTITQNAFSDGTEKYINNGFASKYNQNSGQHIWSTAASGTAGNTISFTQAMTLDASGNLGIGTSSPAALLHLSSSSGTKAIWGTTRSFTVNRNFQVAVDEFNEGQFTITPSTTLGGTTFTTPVVAINASGNLGIGTTSPYNQLESTKSGGSTIGIANSSSGASILYGKLAFYSTVAAGAYAEYGGQIRSYSGAGIDYGDLRFYTGNGAVADERARITSGGEFLVGTTSASSRRLFVLGAGVNDEYFASFQNTNSSLPLGLDIFYSAVAPNSTGSQFLDCRDTGATRLQLRSNGGLANYSANDVNLSDERTKKDIVPLGSMWDKFKAIEIVAFKYKDQTHEDNNIGVIAQQVESVAPEFVDVDGFGDTPEDGVPLKTVYTTDMYHAAIKALQEAMTRIEQLEAKFAALESK